MTTSKTKLYFQVCKTITIPFHLTQSHERSPSLTKKKKKWKPNATTFFKSTCQPFITHFWSPTYNSITPSHQIQKPSLSCLSIFFFSRLSFFFCYFTMNFSSLAFDPSPIVTSRWTPQRSNLHFQHHHRSFVVCTLKLAASSSLSVAKSVASESLSRIGSLNQVSDVLGSQWGDERIGKLVNILADHFDIVARCQVPLLYACFYNFF